MDPTGFKTLFFFFKINLMFFFFCDISLNKIWFLFVQDMHLFLLATVYIIRLVR